MIKSVILLFSLSLLSSLPSSPIRSVAAADRRQRSRQGQGQQQQRQQQGRQQGSSKNKGPDDPYKILGVAKNAKDKEIKSAYRKLALKYHVSAKVCFL